jgi:hypothetical protein
MIDWLRQILGFSPQQQLIEIEVREPSLEERLARILTRVGRLGARSAQEFEELINDLNVVLDILDKIVTSLENIAGTERAKDLRKRLRSKRTRAENALAKLREAS